jgi:transglutaminase-like putative cysteine protease
LPDEGRLSPLAYLAPTALTAPDEALASFAARYAARGGDRRAALLEMAVGVCETIRYEKGVTDVHESAARAFARGQGVCQDHAHAFIAGCRSLGLPARYVSGYLYTGKEGEVASHAWVDAWLGEEQGWTSIDVTQRAYANGRHCRLAVGRDYLDACPVRGVRRGGGPEEMRVAVLVAASEQQ